MKKARRNPELISVTEAVELTGTSRATLFRVIREAGLPRYKAPGRRDTLLERARLEAVLRPRLR